MIEFYDLYVNVVVERVNGIFKVEFIGYNFSYSLEVMKKFVKDSVEIYNCFRLYYLCYMNMLE